MEVKKSNEEVKNQNDLISRQDAIRIVDGIDTWQAGWRGDAIESMKALPSAQPESAKRIAETEQNVSIDDFISRKAAIEAFWQSGVEFRASQIDEVMRIFEQLPSAQPERAKIRVGASRSGMTMLYECDACNEPIDYHDVFCRGCGRRLEHEW